MRAGHDRGDILTTGIQRRTDAVFKHLTNTWYEFVARGRWLSLLHSSVSQKQKISSTAAGLAFEQDLLERS